MRGKPVEETKSSLIAAAYAAFNRRDIDGVLALLTPDVDWPKATEGGRAVGHHEVRAYWTRQWSVLDPRVDPVRIEEDPGGSVSVRVHQVVRDMSGNLLADEFVHHVYFFQGDQISRMEIRPDTEKE